MVKHGSAVFLEVSISDSEVGSANRSFDHGLMLGSPSWDSVWQFEMFWDIASRAIQLWVVPEFLDFVGFCWILLDFGLHFQT